MLNTVYENRGSFGYHGAVTARVFDYKNRLVTEHKSHNGGTQVFFQDLARVLAGELSVDTIRPRFLALYAVQDDTPCDRNWEDLLVGNNLIAASQLLPLESMAYVVDTNEKPLTRLQIKIPFSYITQDNVFIFALYPTSAALTSANDEVALTKAIAYYKLSDSSAWTPFSIDRTASQNSLVIDWSLTFSDQANIKEVTA